MEIKPLEYVYDREKGKVVKKVEINGIPYECDEPGVLYVENHLGVGLFLALEMLDLELSNIPEGFELVFYDSKSIGEIIGVNVSYIWADLELAMRKGNISLYLAIPDTKYDLQDKPYGRNQYITHIRKIAEIIGLKPSLIENHSIGFNISSEEKVSEATIPLRKLLMCVNGLGGDLHRRIKSEAREYCIKFKLQLLKPKQQKPSETLIKVLKEERVTYEDEEERIAKELEINGKRYKGDGLFTIPYNEVKNIHLARIPDSIIEIELEHSSLQREIPELKKLWGSLHVSVEPNELRVEYELYRTLPLEEGPYTIDDHCEVISKCIASKLGFKPSGERSYSSCAFRRRTSDYLCNAIEYVRFLAKEIKNYEEILENAVKEEVSRFLKELSLARKYMS